MALSLGNIVTNVKRRFIEAGDVTKGTVDLFTTPDSPPNGQTAGKVSGSYSRYELWQVLSAVATVMHPTGGIREGVKIRIQAFSGDRGANAVDTILADDILYHFHYPAYYGDIIVPWGIYAEITDGGFALNDIFTFVVNYRKVLDE